MGCVYILIFPNGKVYVGQSKHPAARRFDGHASYPKHPMYVRPVHDAVRAFGPESVTILEVYHSDDEAERLRVERELIVAHDAEDPQHGYNRRPSQWHSPRRASYDNCKGWPRAIH
ncbi:MAG: GIY-YIG nuclease family protein [Phycisphaerales bacterium]|nr:GIY-YIG nuclease family protein [Phycisphaerales bacterium]